MLKITGEDLINKRKKLWMNSIICATPEITKNDLDRQIATGYNGTPPGVKNCYEGGCKRCQLRMEGKLESGASLDRCLFFPLNDIIYIIT